MLGRSFLIGVLGHLLMGLGGASCCRADEQALRPLCRELVFQASQVLDGETEVGVDIKLPRRRCSYLRAAQLEQILMGELEAIGLTIAADAVARFSWDFSDALEILPSGQVPSFRMVLQVPTVGEKTIIQRVIDQKPLLRDLGRPEPYDAAALAQQMVDRLCDSGIKSVDKPRISDMAGTYHVSLSSILEAALRDEIVKRDAGIEIRSQRSASRIVGRTKLIPATDNTQTQAIELAVLLLSEQDEPLSEPAKILIAPERLSESELIEVSAPTGRLVVPEPGQSRLQPLLQMSAGQQIPVLVDGEIRCSENSAYGFRVHPTELDIDETGKPYLRLMEPFVATVEEGVATIRVRRGQNLAIVMHNRDAFDAGLKVEIDGLSSFSFAQTSQLPLYHSRAQREPLVVDRWYFNDESGHAFMAGTIEQGAYRQRSSDRSRLGKIRLTVHRAYRAGQSFDKADEPYLAGTRGTPLVAGSEIAIARGPRVPGQAEAIELMVGRAREVLTIVYEPQLDEDSASSDSIIE